MSEEVCVGCGKIHGDKDNEIFKASKEIITFAMTEAKMIHPKGFQFGAIKLLRLAYNALATAFLDQKDFIKNFEEDISKSKENYEKVMKIKKGGGLLND